MKRLTALVLALLMMLCAFSAVAEESPSQENSTYVTGEPNIPDTSNTSNTSTNATAQSANQTVAADASEKPITFANADVEEGSELAIQLDEDLANKVETFSEGVTEEALKAVYLPETVAKLRGMSLEFVDHFVMQAKVPARDMVGDQKVTSKTLGKFVSGKLYKVVATLLNNGEGAEVILEAEADEEGALVMVIPEADAKAMADAVVVICDVFEVK